MIRVTWFGLALALLASLGGCSNDWSTTSAWSSPAATLTVTAQPAATPVPANGTKWFGVVQSDGAFGTYGWDQQGNYGCDYRYPGVPGGCGYDGHNSYKYFADRGLPLVRLTFRQGNLQPGVRRTGTAPDFDQAEVDRIRASLDVAYAAGNKAFMAAWTACAMGTTDDQLRGMPDACFTDFWTKVITAFGNHPAIWGWEVIDNEPNNWGGWGDTDYGKQRFAQVAQDVVDTIRATGDSHWILVPGLGSQRAEWWPDRNPYLDVTDPLNHFAYSAHTYWNCPGDANYSYDGCGYPNVAVDRIQPLMTWLQAKASQGKYARGIFTEYAVPDDDSRWFTVLDNFLSYVEAQPLLIGGTYWAAGTGWCSSADKIHVEPCKGLDRPQEPTLARHPTR